ncbi:MAG: hypothetical protein PWQ39_1279 [Thermacetogenium sp.]|uniref:Uncharacterized protein n=1 Tax=Thermacetogenium phaeum TaxID=85874 RepID=A0A101FEW4_9THEO|nr:MAG: Uncharacterized protein XD66_1545 [Thermacetogenium phaeum]MDN5376239.1 hypothetical protein [Thermacetogenium sp.]
MPTVKEQLVKALQHERLLLRVYEELEKKLGKTALARDCRLLAEKTREQIDRINSWLNCSG